MSNSSQEFMIDGTASLDDSVRIVGSGALTIERGVSVEPNVFIHLGEAGCGSVRIGARSRLKIGTVIRTYGGSITIGQRSSLGEYGVWAGHGGIIVGDNVIIGPHCSITASEHIFSSDIPIRFQGEEALGIRIEDGAWLGAGVRVLDGCVLGNGAVVGAGSIVTRSTSVGSVSVGVPARTVDLRVTSEEREAR